MRKHKVGAVLVTDEENHLLGIFTGRDAVGRVLAEGKDAKKTKLAEVMVREVLPETLPLVAERVVSPTVAELARPCEPAALLRVATRASLEDHVTCVVRFCVELSV